MTESDAVECAVAFARAGADALVLSGGNVARAGFYMLRGDVPVAEMQAAMPHRVKAVALRMFSNFYVPVVPFEQGACKKKRRRRKKEEEQEQEQEEEQEEEHGVGRGTKRSTMIGPTEGGAWTRCSSATVMQ